MVSITSLKIFIYFFFLTFLIVKVYPDECSPELDPCEYCICDCETTSNQGREWCDVKYAFACLPPCLECIS